MAHFTSTSTSGATSNGRVGRRRFYRWRLCRFEHLEIRQVLSAASVSTEPVATPDIVILPSAKPNLAPLTPEGFTPTQIRQAYGFNSIAFPGGIQANGKGTTIAIVDAFNNPTIVSDLNTFDTTFGLPAPPSFKIVNEHGSTLLPTNNTDWAGEIALDVEWAHAIAPAANILLVEATDNSLPFLGLSNLEIAVNYAKQVAGVVVVSNSYGGQEYTLTESAGDNVYTTPSGHANVSFVFSAGDTGGPAAYPSVSPNVLSVGGTSLILTPSNNYSGETVWNNLSGAGGGGQSGLLTQDLLTGAFSLSIPAENVPSYQAGLGLTGRGTPDVSYDGDPATGYAVYSSYAFGGWEEIGGTSAGAPQWSALIAIADQGRALQGKTSLANVQSIIYKLPSADFHDITIGNNNFYGTIFPGQGYNLGITGNAAGPGYDLASGRGTPLANLVIRDLVSFNGSTFVSPMTRTIVGGSNGSWYFFGKSPTKATAYSDSEDGGSALTADTDVDDGASISRDASSLDQFTNPDSNLVSSASTAGSLRYDDTASLQLASDSHDDGTYLSRHFHGMYDADADSSSAVLDDFFATV